MSSPLFYIFILCIFILLFFALTCARYDDAGLLTEKRSHIKKLLLLFITLLFVDFSALEWIFFKCCFSVKGGKKRGMYCWKVGRTMLLLLLKIKLLIQSHGNFWKNWKKNSFQIFINMIKLRSWIMMVKSMALIVRKINFCVGLNIHAPDLCFWHLPTLF